MSNKHGTGSPTTSLPKPNDADKPINVTVNEDEKSVKNKESMPPFSNYWRFFSYGSRNDFLLLSAGVTTALASGVALPLMNIVFGNLVGDFSGYFIPGSGVTERQFKNSVNRNALYLVYLFIGKFCLTYISMLSFRMMSLRMSAALRLAYMRSLLAQPISKLDVISAGSVANTITSSANTVQMSTSDRLAQMLQAVALIISAYAIAFRYSWALTLVSSSAILFIVLVYSLIVPITIKRQQSVEKADEKHASIAGEVFGSIRTVSSLGAQNTLTEKYCSWVTESKKRALHMSPLIAIQMAPSYFAIYSSFGLSFWFGLKLYREGHIDNVNTVITTFFSIFIVVSVLSNLVAPLMLCSKAVAVSKGFFDVIDAPGVTYEGYVDNLNFSEADIEFKNVSFEYPSRADVLVLKDVSIKLEKGKTTALVGPSGCGKSTIVALLLRWYNLPSVHQDLSTKEQAKVTQSTTITDIDAEEDQHQSRCSGELLVGGYRLNDIGLKLWRSQIGLVQQEPFLFNDTIYNNVAFGLLGTSLENETEDEKRKRVEDACTEAFATEFIERLPKGYSTLVGESGIKLSGGQRQRIAIARSIVRNPKILILDEATSSIDVRSEKIIQQALDRVSKNRTTLIIAHRLSTISKADKIIVLQNGSKVEEGSHESLMADDNGLYSGLVHAQQLLNESTQNLDDGEDQLDSLSRDLSTGAGGPQGVDEEITAKYKDRGFFRTIGLLLFEQRTRWPYYVAAFLSAIAAGSAYSLQSWFFAHLIEAFQFTGQRLKAAGDYWSLRFFLLAVGMAMAYFVLGYATNSVAAYVAAVYRTEFFQNIVRQPISFYDKEGNASGSLMSMLSSDPKTLQELLGTTAQFPLIAIFNVIGCVTISFYFGWKLTVVTFFSAMPVIFVAAFARIRWELQFEEHNTRVFASSSQFATEAAGAFRTVTSLTMEDYIVNKYSTLLNDQIRAAFRKAWYAMLVFALSDSLELCAIALGFWYGGQLLATREYNPVQFFVVYTAIIQGGQVAGMFASFAPNIAKAVTAANRIISFRPKHDEVDTSVIEANMITLSPNASAAKIEFRNVSFKYASREIPVFINLNITIQPGEFVGFVGASGCGKTSTISLLERFYSPTFGTILLDDQDISTLEISLYRSALSLVSQEPRLFDGTIRENLLLGLPNSETVEDGTIIEACKSAEIHDFITSLPDGYSTALGINTQTALSGGQKQRVCLARALLRNPRLLLLDEATSSLDSQSERLVQSALERLAEQRSMTVIAVAHRLATIQKADVIFVFSESEAGNGTRILERGSHAELLRRRGAYWQMCQAQALDR